MYQNNVGKYLVLGNAPNENSILNLQGCNFNDTRQISFTEKIIVSNNYHNVPNGYKVRWSMKGHVDVDLWNDRGTVVIEDGRKIIRVVKDLPEYHHVLMRISIRTKKIEDMLVFKIKHPIERTLIDIPDSFQSRFVPEEEFDLVVKIAH